MPKPAKKAADKRAKPAAKKPKLPVRARRKPTHKGEPDNEVVPPALPAGEPEPATTLPIELDPRALEEGLKKLGGELKHWMNKGRYTKVRFKFRGKPLLPDLPLAAVAAAEGLTFYWTGILRLLLVNVAGRALIDVELVNDADKKVQAGREALLSGDADAALALFREALVMDRENAGAHLNIGVALKLRGDRAGARAAFDTARRLDPTGPVGAEAERLVQTL